MGIITAVDSADTRRYTVHKKGGTPSTLFNYWNRKSTKSRRTIFILVCSVFIVAGGILVGVLATRELRAANHYLHLERGYAADVATTTALYHRASLDPTQNQISDAVLAKFNGLFKCIGKHRYEAVGKLEAGEYSGIGNPSRITLPYNAAFHVIVAYDIESVKKRKLTLYDGLADIHLWKTFEFYWLTEDQVRSLLSQ